MIIRFDKWILNEKKLYLSDFKKGDRIIYIYNGEETNTHDGKRRDLYGFSGRVLLIRRPWLAIEFDKPLLNFGHTCDNTGKIGHCYYVLPEFVKHEDLEKKKEIERKREEIRLRNLDIDPYSEEDWMD